MSMISSPAPSPSAHAAMSGSVIASGGMSKPPAPPLPPPLGPLPPMPLPPPGMPLPPIMLEPAPPPTMPGPAPPLPPIGPLPPVAGFINMLLPERLALEQPLTMLIMYSVVAMPHALAMNSRRSMPSRRETSSAFSLTSFRIKRLRALSGHQPSPLDTGPHAIGNRNGGSGSVFFRFLNHGKRLIIPHPPHT
jgi:hypothetical protein